MNANGYLKFTFIFSGESFLILFLILWEFLIFDFADDLMFGLLFNIISNDKLIPRDKQKKAKGYTLKNFSYSGLTLFVRHIHQAKSKKRKI